MKMSIGLFRASFVLLLIYSAAGQSSPSTSPGPSPSNANGFISAVGTDFATKDCYQYVYSGANVWLLADAQAGASGGSPAQVDNMFSIAKANGINNIRFFPFGVLPSFQLITGPGQNGQLNYNPAAWAAIDAIIQKAASNNIRLIMPFSDNWNPVNGKWNFVQWAIPGETDPDTFFTDARVKTLYKNYIQTFLNRVNSLTGVAYKNDPTIFGFDLINEMRSACNTSTPNISCTPAATTYVQSWVQEISSYVKTIDSNHLLTTGEEGFYAPGSEANQYNPGQLFAVGSAQDFIQNHAVPTIDYAVTHIWVDNWSTNATQCNINNNPSCGPDFVSKWLGAHISDAKNLNKPFVIEEFGQEAQQVPPNYALRNPIFAAGYGPYNQSLQDNGSTDLKGIAFWQWVWSNDIATGGADNDYAVRTGDDTFNTIISPSFALTTAYNSANMPVANCVPGATKSTAAGAPTSSPPSGGTSSAGRKLM